MRVDGLPQYYFSYKRVTGGLTVPISTSYPDDNPWRTIGWDRLIEDPGDPDSPGTVSVNNGWTFLYGPAYFNITAAVGMSNVTPQASTHLQLWSTSQTSGTIPEHSWEGWEWPVLDLEGNTSHFTGAWNGRLPAGQRLRLRLDWWHPADPDSEPLVDRAHVEGLYWRILS